MHSDDATCNPKNRSSTIAGVTLASDGMQVSASFTFHAHGVSVLCYRFSHSPYMPWQQFTMVRVAVLQTSGPPLPYGTAIGCVSTITIHGLGFRLFSQSPLLSLSCLWGAYGTTMATESVQEDFRIQTYECTLTGSKDFDSRDVDLLVAI